MDVSFPGAQGSRGKATVIVYCEPFYGGSVYHRSDAWEIKPRAWAGVAF